MYYSFSDTPPEIEGDKIIASALNGVVYTENNRLYVKTSAKHLVYKYDGSPVGWYQRNIKTLDDIYLGKCACPSAELESLTIKDEEAWDDILMPEPVETAEAKK